MRIERPRPANGLRPLARCKELAATEGTVSDDDLRASTPVTEAHCSALLLRCRLSLHHNSWPRL